jgi:hypothetical protein
MTARPTEGEGDFSLGWAENGRSDARCEACHKYCTMSQLAWTRRLPTGIEHLASRSLDR